MDVALIVLLIIVSIPVVGLAGYFILIFLAALISKLPVPAGMLIADPQAKAGPYISAMMEEARSYDLDQWKIYRHVKHSERHALSFACDGRVLVDIAEGRRLGIRVWQTALISPPFATTYPATVDNLLMPDFSGLWDMKEIVNADFAELMEAHQRRLGDIELTKPFVEPNPMDALMHIDRERVNRAADLGRARWVDTAHGAFRFTVRGALWVSASMIVAMARWLKQWNRIDKRRPGETPPKVPR